MMLQEHTENEILNEIKKLLTVYLRSPAEHIDSILICI